MDICIEFMLNDPVSGAYARGDVIAVYPAAQIGALSGPNYVPHNPVSMPRTRWLFVTGVPEEILGVAVTMELLNGVLAQSRYFNDETFVHNRLWNFWADTPQGLKNAINSDGYDTWTFAQFRGRLKRKDLQTFITDDELIL